MIITCPSCKTRFRIPPNSLGSKGRSLRCSSCGHRWFLEPFAEIPQARAPEPREGEPPRDAQEPPIEATPLAGPAPAVTGRPRRRGGGLVALLLAVLLVLVLVGLAVGRNQVVAALPQALPIYQRLGLPVTLQLGLEFRNLSSEAAGEPGAGLKVAGEIHNLAAQERLLPRLRVALLNEQRQEIESGFFDAPQERLEPGGTARFEVSLANPPEAARSFSISFADTP